MTRTHFVIAAAGGSLTLLLAAWAFQHIGGLAPCKMCIWQRYPHGIAALFGAVALFVPITAVLALGAIAALSTGVIGAYHVGVEQGWWEGPSSCSAGSLDGISTNDLMDQILTAPLVRCDDIAWSLAGVSMAGWNAILSFALVGLWLMAMRKA